MFIYEMPDIREILNCKSQASGMPAWIMLGAARLQANSMPYATAVPMSKIEHSARTAHVASG